MGRRLKFDQCLATFRPHQPDQRSPKTEMAGSRLIIAGLALALTGCSDAAAPPSELDGLWSTGDASCAAGVGIRFTEAAIMAIYPDQEEVLFAAPQYDEISSEGRFRVRVTYQLPDLAGAGPRPGAHGVIVLSRHGGLLAPESHAMVDGLTGSARMRIGDDPVTTALTLQPCGRHPWREPLRGLTPA